MPLKVFKLDEPPTSPGIGIYGPSGAGKTTLIGTMPGTGIYIDVPTLEGGGFVIGDHAHRIGAVRCEEWEDLEDIYWALAKRDSSELPQIEKARWFSLDSTTGMHVLATRKIINERDRSLGERPHQITLQERGWISQLEAEMIFRFRSLPYWGIFIAQERTHGGNDNDVGPVQIGPDLPNGALRPFRQSMTLLGRLDVVLTDRGKEERQLRVGPPGGDYIVKARTRPGKRLPRVIKDPNLGDIFRYMYGDGPKPKAAKDDSTLSF